MTGGWLVHTKDTKEDTKNTKGSCSGGGASGMIDAFRVVSGRFRAFVSLVSSLVSLV